MKFQTPHDLLVFLVELSSDSSRVFLLQTGEQVIREAIDRGLMEWNQHDLDTFARLLFLVRDEGSITFEDYGRHSRLPGATMVYNDAAQAARITISSMVRMAVGGAQPSISIQQLALGSITNVRELTVLVSEMERGIDAADASEETKEEAHGRLRRLADTATEIGTGAAGDLLATVLRQAGGFPGG